MRLKRRILPCYPEGEAQRIKKENSHEILRQAGRQSLSCTNHAQNDMDFEIGINTCHPEDKVRRIYKNSAQEILRFAQNDMFFDPLSETRGSKKEMLKRVQHDKDSGVILNLFQDLKRKSIKCHTDVSKQEGILRQAGRQSLSCTNHAQNDMAFKIWTNICYPEDEVRRISKKNEQRILRFAQNDKKCAFTLAEVLITLGVIGIVAAMTIPQLITSYKKKVTIERLKTTYSILSQAINMSKEKNGDIDTWDTSLSNIDFAKLYILPYIKTVGTIKKYKKGITPPPLYSLSVQAGWHSSYIHWTGNLTNCPIYVMANGSWFVYKNSYIVVDLNGQGEPNVMGIDGFSFYLDPKSNQLVPTGYGKTRDQLIKKKDNYTDACVRDNSWQYYRGGSCAALMMMDGWKMTKDYPWGNGGLTPLNK